MNNTSKRFKADHMERYRFASKIAQGKSILDLACGAGYATPLFIGAGISSYDGVDINETQLASASDTYALSDLINYHVGDICTFNSDKTFDIITCYGIIEHVENYESAIKNFYSLLNPGGALLISSPNRHVTSPYCSSIDDKPADKLHAQEFTPAELLSILNCSGFSVSKEKVFGQRQRRLYSIRFLNKIIQAVLKKLKKSEGSTVTKVRDKAPEHFIVVATKV